MSKYNETVECDVRKWKYHTCTFHTGKEVVQ